jgi:hypothetical protein
MIKVSISGPTRRTWFFQPHPASAGLAARVLADQLDAGTIQGIDDSGQRFDDAANIADAGFHSLDRW